MKIKGLLIPVTGLLLLLAGCVTPPAPPIPPPPPSVIPPVPASGVAVPPVPSPAALTPIEPPQRADMSRNRAVVALLEQAHASSAAGRHGAADSALERALRIEPRNPWIWEEMAQVRLVQGLYDQAISIARKSNSFAGNRHLVQAINWQLIGKARIAKGDSDGANQAFQQASSLAQQAKSEPPAGQ